MKAKVMAYLARDAALDKKAEQPVILDLQKVSNVASYFVILHGNSDRHVKAIAEHVHMTMKQKGIALLHQEGLTESLWILLDFGEVIVHVFYKDTRDYYGLERLWGDAPQI